MGRQFDVVIERDEEGMYVASVPQLPGCHTDAASLDELMVEIREAIELCLEVQASVVTANPANGGHLKTGQREQSVRTPVVIPCRRVVRQYSAP
jgi:predicted RNase H-like HicB family nuclease